MNNLGEMPEVTGEISGKKATSTQAAPSKVKIVTIDVEATTQRLLKLSHGISSHKALRIAFPVSHHPSSSLTDLLAYLQSYPSPDEDLSRVSSPTALSPISPKSPRSPTSLLNARSGSPPPTRISPSPFALVSALFSVLLSLPENPGLAMLCLSHILHPSRLQDYQPGLFHDEYLKLYAPLTSKPLKTLESPHLYTRAVLARANTLFNNLPAHQRTHNTSALPSIREGPASPLLSSPLASPSGNMGLGLSNLSLGAAATPSRAIVASLPVFSLAHLIVMSLSSCKDIISITATEQTTPTSAEPLPTIPAILPPSSSRSKKNDNHPKTAQPSQPVVLEGLLPPLSASTSTSSNAYVSSTAAAVSSSASSTRSTSTQSRTKHNQSLNASNARGFFASAHTTSSSSSTSSSSLSSSVLTTPSQVTMSDSTLPPVFPNDLMPDIGNLWPGDALDYFSRYNPQLSASIIRDQEKSRNGLFTNSESDRYESSNDYSMFSSSSTTTGKSAAKTVSARDHIYEPFPLIVRQEEKEPRSSPLPSQKSSLVTGNTTNIYEYYHQSRNKSNEEQGPAPTEEAKAEAEGLWLYGCETSWVTQEEDDRKKKQNPKPKSNMRSRMRDKKSRKPVESDLSDVTDDEVVDRDDVDELESFFLASDNVLQILRDRKHQFISEKQQGNEFSESKGDAKKVSKKEKEDKHRESKDVSESDDESSSNDDEFENIVVINNNHTPSKSKEDNFSEKNIRSGIMRNSNVYLLRAAEIDQAKDHEEIQTLRTTRQLLEKVVDNAFQANSQLMKYDQSTLPDKKLDSGNLNFRNSSLENRRQSLPHIAHKKSVHFIDDNEDPAHVAILNVFTGTNAVEPGLQPPSMLSHHTHGQSGVIQYMKTLWANNADIITANTSNPVNPTDTTSGTITTTGTDPEHTQSGIPPNSETLSLLSFLTCDDKDMSIGSTSTSQPPSSSGSTALTASSSTSAIMPTNGLTLTRVASQSSSSLKVTIPRSRPGSASLDSLRISTAGLPSLPEINVPDVDIPNLMISTSDTASYLVPALVRLPMNSHIKTLTNRPALVVSQGVNEEWPSLHATVSKQQQRRQAQAILTNGARTGSPQKSSLTCIEMEVSPLSSLPVSSLDVALSSHSKSKEDYALESDEFADEYLQKQQMWLKAHAYCQRDDTCTVWVSYDGFQRSYVPITLRKYNGLWRVLAFEALFAYPDPLDVALANGADVDKSIRNAAATLSQRYQM